jgi:hypothetical protein
MAQFDFPSSPSTNQTYTANGVTYKWDGVAWRRITTTGAQGNQGATGSTGAQGAQGHQGATGSGAQGATGSTGAQGAQGHQGNTGGGGSTGAQGATGATGAQGATGATGAQGATGSTGAQGAQGHQGNTGSTGAQGDAGSRSYTVTNNGSSNYVIDGSSNPTLNLLRGFTYTFNINASGHPFYIKTAQTTGTGNQYTSGVTGNGTQSGTLTFAVPYNAPSTLYYICQYHSAMKGTISISDVGPTGAQGATGATGAQGAQGHQGSTGNTGAQGATGSGGSTGAQGAAGAQGATGSGGGTGAQGAAGAQGATGNTGAQGGLSTYSIPSGGIIIWSGAANAIPSGWVLCDGNNSTPDLRGKFIVGYSNTDGLFDVADTGGSKDAVLVSHTHNLQNHVHGINLTTNDPGDHNHTYNQGNVVTYAFTGGAGSVRNQGVTSSNTSAAGGHTHTVSGNTGTPATNTTDTLGESATNKNLPPYYALCYIMKT